MPLSWILNYAFIIALFASLAFAGCTGRTNPDSISTSSLRSSPKIIGDENSSVNSLNTAQQLSGSPEERYLVDTTHSSIQFKVRHWGIYDVIGWFESYEILVGYEMEDFSDLVVEAKLRPASIRMPNMEMVKTLNGIKSGFFDSANYPEILFHSESFNKGEANKFVLRGVLKIKEISLPVDFEVVFNGYAHPPTRTNPGFTLIGKFNRLDFNLGGVELLPGNGFPVIGTEVFITANVRLISEYD